MPIIPQETIKVEGGLSIGGTVIFDDPIFTELPKITATPFTNIDSIVRITSRSITGFTYKIKKRYKRFFWRNGTNEIPVLWLAIQEK